MSPEARAQRYFTPMTRLPSAMATALADVDGDRHVAWAAALGDRPVGLARYLLDDTGVAEVAFEVADAFRGAGIGTMLLDSVTTVAAARGVRRVRATVLPGNQPSRRMLVRLGVHLDLVDGLLEGDGPLRLLDPPRVDRQAVVALACRVASTEGRDGPCAAVGA
jgi:RimJ/RimL family protein N-acetyltransferase